MTMAASIELRVPFLDHKFVEYGFSIPAHLKINRGSSKYIEKYAMDAILPNEIVYREKVGFQTPVGNWIKNGWAVQISELLLSGSASRAYFDKASIIRTLNEHTTSVKDHSQLLWNLVIFELWYQSHIQTSVS
jgi:asparagine synthase (glutamine-hydrolysing)